MNYAIKAAQQQDGEGFSSFGTAQELWPDTSFPFDGPNQAWLDEYNAVRVLDFMPYNKFTERLNTVAPYGHTDGRVYNVVPEPLPEANAVVSEWIQFNDDLMSLPEAVALLNTLRDNNFGAALSLAVGLGQAALGTPATFVAVWWKLSAAGLITKEMAAQVQEIGARHNLPKSFLVSLNLQPNQPEQSRVPSALPKQF